MRKVHVPEMRSDLPVLLINSAKSPMESLSTLASRGCGAFARNLDPVFDEGRETGLNALADLVDTWDSVGGFECNPVSLVIDEE